MSCRTSTMVPAHRLLLLPQALDPDKVVKVLKLRQNISKKNYDKQSKDLPPLEVEDKVQIHPAKQRARMAQSKSYGIAKVIPLEDEQGCFYRRNRRQIIAVPNDQPMHPTLRDPVVPTFHDSPRSPQLPETDQPASTQAEVPIKFTVDAHRPPITRRSGRQAKKPERFIESC